MKFTFDDGTVLDHRDALLKFFEADGVTPASGESPLFDRDYILVLGPVRLARFDTTKDSEGTSEE